MTDMEKEVKVAASGLPTRVKLHEALCCLYLLRTVSLPCTLRICSFSQDLPTVLCGDISFGTILPGTAHSLIRIGISVLLFLLQSVNFNLLLE